MATFFGEVVTASSRALDEDEDYDDDDDLAYEDEEDERIHQELQEKREVQLNWGPGISAGDSGTVPCSNVIIAVGHNATNFLSAYVLNSVAWEEAGHTSVWKEGKTAVFHRYKDNTSVLICQVTNYVPEDQLFQWTDKVLGCLQKAGLSVTVLSDSPVSDYKTTDMVYSSSSAPFLRCLRTSTSRSQALCRPLEPPNIITGLPAAVLSQCQIHHIPAVVYQCYTDVITPDSITMETYKPLLSSLSKVVKLNPSPSAEILCKYVKSSEIQSNLYI